MVFFFLLLEQQRGSGQFGEADKALARTRRAASRRYHGDDWAGMLLTNSGVSFAIPFSHRRPQSPPLR